ncbi:terminase small subunit [uncultured Enterococcus sp.]|uniref:terminase small subunit n=1 Tax=uncultured Enterococcus sp. TaxID=167972 RepID=UPI002AA87AEA|nr:terminase small subunit [uncultured Enterococcus sp.]
MAKLTVKQKAFAEEYIINGGNATQAAIKAGYSKKTAAVIGKENLTKPNITEFISKHVKPVEEKRQIDIEATLNELIDIFQGKEIESHSKQIDHLDGDTPVKDMTYIYTPDLENRLKALDLFLKYKNPLLQAQLRKARAEAAIAENKADKLTANGKVNDLLQSLLDVRSGGDGSG